MKDVELFVAAEHWGLRCVELCVCTAILGCSALLQLWWLVVMTARVRGNLLIALAPVKMKVLLLQVIRELMPILRAPQCTFTFMCTSITWKRRRTAQARRIKSTCRTSKRLWSLASRGRSPSKSFFSASNAAELIMLWTRAWRIVHGKLSAEAMLHWTWRVAVTLIWTVVCRTLLLLAHLSETRWDTPIAFNITSWFVLVCLFDIRSSIFIYYIRCLMFYGFDGVASIYIYVCGRSPCLSIDAGVPSRCHSSTEGVLQRCLRQYLTRCLWSFWHSFAMFLVRIF